jgi:hypothetical protein
VNPVVAQEQPAEPPAPAPPAKPAPPPPKAIAALLRKADKAFAEGHLLEPKETSAFALYTQVLDADQENAAARAGLAKVHDALVKQVDAALDRDDETDASRAIAQLETLPPQGTELETLRARLKLLKQTGPLLTRAADLLSQGHATEPKGANALAVYRDVLKLDPNNKLAEQGLVQVQRATSTARSPRRAGRLQRRRFDTRRGLARCRPVRELLDTRTRIEAFAASARPTS